MPNTTLTADVIAKAALAVLDNEFGWLNKMHRVYEDEYSETVNGYKKGATISIRRPADFTVRTGPVAAAQDVIEGKVPLTIDQQIGVDFKFTSTELTLNVNQLTERIIKPAMVNIVNHVGNDILTQAYRGVYNAVGTPGQAINSFADFARGPERLDEMAVPSSDRYSVMVPNDFWNMVGSQTTLGGSRASDGAYRNGTLGDVGGISTYMTQVMPRHTVGVATGTPLVNGAAQSVTYDTAKNTWTQTLNADGWTASIAGILKAGDVFTIADVFAVNPKTKAVLAHLQQFVVTADVTSTAGGVGNPVISPPIIVSGPHQTVSIPEPTVIHPVPCMLLRSFHRVHDRLRVEHRLRHRPTNHNGTVLDRGVQNLGRDVRFETGGVRRHQPPFLDQYSPRLFQHDDQRAGFRVAGFTHRHVHGADG